MFKFFFQKIKTEPNAVDNDDKVLSNFTLECGVCKYRIKCTKESYKDLVDNCPFSGLPVKGSVNHVF